MADMCRDMGRQEELLHLLNLSHTGVTVLRLLASLLIFAASPRPLRMQMNPSLRCVRAGCSTAKKAC